MSDLLSFLSVPVLIHVLDLFGTMAFAVTGAFKAIEHKYDIVGVIILSTITGIAGGVIRDVIFGKYPPTAFINPSYLILTVSTAIIIFVIYPRIKIHWNLFLKFDAVGLGVFTVIGASVAYHLFGMNILLMSFAGVVTAIGGGILRDVFVNDVPLVFIKEIYATTSFIGILIFYIMLSVGVNFNTSTIASILITTSIRILAMKFNWNLPRVRL